MTAWWDRPLCALDLETTATDPEQARIVQAAVVLAGGAQPTREHVWLVAPDFEIPAEATEVHGITTERARDEGWSLPNVLQRVLALLKGAWLEGCAVVAFNARYDLTVLDRECRRCGVDAGLLARLAVIDPMVVDRHLHRYRRGSRKLIATCEHYGVRLDGEHDAAFDALAAARLAWVLGRRGEVIRRAKGDVEVQELVQLRREWYEVRADPMLLHGAQRRWAERQAIELQQYFRDGNPAKGVPPQPDRVVPDAWPILPVPADR